MTLCLLCEYCLQVERSTDHLLESSDISNGEDNHEVKLKENSTLANHPDTEKLEHDTSHLTDMDQYVLDEVI